MPGFDREVAKLAQRVLINPRKIDWHTGVLATKVTPGQQAHRTQCAAEDSTPAVPGMSRFAACAGVPGVKPVLVELTDFKTKKVVDELEVDAVLVATGRAPFTQARPPLLLSRSPYAATTPHIRNDQLRGLGGGP